MKITEIYKSAKVDEEGYTYSDDEIRYIIVDEVTGEILDDAQGYGYKTYEKARAAYYYKYGGGREKQNEYEIFWKQNIEIANFIGDFATFNMKELARGETTIKDLQDEIIKRFGVKIPINLIKKYNLAFAEPKKKKKKKKF